MAPRREYTEEEQRKFDLDFPILVDFPAREAHAFACNMYNSPEYQNKRNARTNEETAKSPNSFILFRSALSKELSSRVKLTSPDLSKVMGVYWQRLLSHERNEWEERARAEKATHEASHPIRKAQPRKSKKTAENPSPSRFARTTSSGDSAARAGPSIPNLLNYPSSGVFGFDPSHSSRAILPMQGWTENSGLSYLDPEYRLQETNLSQQFAALPAVANPTNQGQSYPGSYEYMPAAIDSIALPSMLESGPANIFSPDLPAALPPVLLVEDDDALSYVDPDEIGLGSPSSDQQPLARIHTPEPQDDDELSYVDPDEFRLAVPESAQEDSARSNAPNALEDELSYVDPDEDPANSDITQQPEEYSEALPCTDLHEPDTAGDAPKQHVDPVDSTSGEVDANDAQDSLSQIIQRLDLAASHSPSSHDTMQTSILDPVETDDHIFCLHIREFPDYWSFMNPEELSSSEHAEACNSMSNEKYQNWLHGCFP